MNGYVHSIMNAHETKSIKVRAATRHAKLLLPRRLSKANQQAKHDNRIFPIIKF